MRPLAAAVVTPMTKTSFLARTTWGQPRYLLVGMACMFVLALAPMGVKRALRPALFAPEQLLSADASEMQDLGWVRSHFNNDAEVVVSWDGCTLGDSEPLALLAKKLATHDANGERLFAAATSGPQVLRSLMDAQPGLSYADAITRLEGSLVGPPQSDALGRTLGNSGRATCLLVKLTPAAMKSMASRRAALDAIPVIAKNQCGIEPAGIRMVGPVIDSVSVGVETPRKLVALFVLMVGASAGVCLWRMRSVRLTAIVVGVAAASGALAMAIPWYGQILQVLWQGHPSVVTAGLPAQFAAVPFVIYLFTLAAALHLTTAYAEARRLAAPAREAAAAEDAASIVLRPIVVGAMAMVAVLAMLATGEISMLRQFSAYAAPGVVIAVALLLGVATVVLHRYPLERSRLNSIQSGGKLNRLSRLAINHSWPTLGVSLLSLLVVSVGMWNLGAALTPADFQGGSATVARDVRWFEQRLGSVTPLDVVLTMPAEHLREANENAERDGQQYRLTMSEQIELVREASRRLAACPALSGVLSAATFEPPVSLARPDGARRAHRAESRQQVRDNLLAGEYLRLERNGGGGRFTGRELWRISARVTPTASADAGSILAQVRQAIDPLLWSYQQRDRVVQTLHERGKELANSGVCVLFRAPDHATQPATSAQEHVLGELLSKSGTTKSVCYFNLAAYDRPGRGDAPSDDAYRRAALATLRQSDVVVLASAASDPTARKMAAAGILLADVTDQPQTTESSTTQLADGGGPRPIRAAYAGTTTVVERAESILLGSLAPISWASLGLIGVVLALAARSVPAGSLLLVVGVAPPIAVMSAAGWLGVNLDLGIVTAVALSVGLSVAGAMHMAAWYDRALSLSHDRGVAAERAILASLPAMLNILLIVSLGVMPLALSSLASLRAVAIVAAVSAAATAIACSSVFPALLASPLSWFLAPAEVRRLDPLWPRLQALVAQWRQTPLVEPGEDDAELLPLPHAPKAPHFTDVPAAAPAPGRRAVLSLGADERREIAEGPHAALQAKLHGLRRPRTGDSPAS